MKNIFNSIRFASENIKANPLHTFLSIIGIVIGVAIGGESIIVIVVVALFVVIVFGTYPAWRAANLTPVEAIRHE